MKNKVFLMLVCIIGVIYTTHGQTRNETILKVSYIANSMTPSMASILKDQIPSEDQYSMMVEKISKYQMHYSLYLNTKTNESIFVLDSLSKEDGVSIAGYIDYVYTNPSGEFVGSENFMGEQVIYRGNTLDFKWKLINETRELNGKICHKAISETYPYVSVWYLPEIPTQKGPGTFLGLPGLSFSASDFFFFIEITEISTDITNEEFDIVVENYRDKLNGKLLDYKNLLKSKDNTINMMKRR